MEVCDGSLALPDELSRVENTPMDCHGQQAGGYGQTTKCNHGRYDLVRSL